MGRRNACRPKTAKWRVNARKAIQKVLHALQYAFYYSITHAHPAMEGWLTDPDMSLVRTCQNVDTLGSDNQM